MKKLGIVLLACLLTSTIPVEASAIPVAHTLHLNSYFTTDSSRDRPGDPIASGEPLPSCFPAATSTRWLSVSSELPGLVDVRAYADEELGVQALALYRGGTFADVVELGCATNPQPFSVGVTAHINAGETLYAQVVATGSYTGSATVYQSAGWDTFATAEELGVGYEAGWWSTDAATVEPHEPLACGGGRTGWLKFVPRQQATVTFMVLATWNDVMALYRGTSFADLQSLGCAELNTYQLNGSFDVANELRITTTVQPGQTYYLQIGTTTGRGGTFAISVFKGTAVANDTVVRALPIDVGSTYQGTTNGAFSHPMGWLCGQFGTVWYRVAAPLSGVMDVTMNSQPTTARRNFMPALEVHSAATGERLACAGDTQQSVTVSVSVQAGESFLIAATSNGFPGDYRIQIRMR